MKHGKAKNVSSLLDFFNSKYASKIPYDDFKNRHLRCKYCDRKDWKQCDSSIELHNKYKIHRHYLSLSSALGKTLVAETFDSYPSKFCSHFWSIDSVNNSCRGLLHKKAQNINLKSHFLRNKFGSSTHSLPETLTKYYTSDSNYISKLKTRMATEEKIHTYSILRPILIKVFF